MSSVLIRQGDKNICVTAVEGETLIEVLRRNGVMLSAPCGGNGKCGKCLVDLEYKKEKKTVLACKTAVAGDCCITVKLQSSGLICTDSEGESSASPGRKGLGAAVDIGTTTVAIRLLDLSNGKTLGTNSAWNAQAPYGADVISRTQYIMEHGDGLDRLSSLIRQQVSQLLHELCKQSGKDIHQLHEIFVAGNTIMQHIFAGISPAGIAVAPFKAETLFSNGESMELDGVPVHFAPCVAGYVGGDISSGLLSSGLYKTPGRSLFLDVGTNGEMALGGEDGFICCAVASGPAFEGAGICCGMASTEGAISHVSWDNGLKLQVIGGGAPKGLCGSGLIELLALLLERGIVDGSGRLLAAEEAPAGYEKWLGEDENGNGIFYLTEDRSVYFCAKDVRQIQLAKAAVAAGIAVLLKEAGVGAEELNGLYLAGGFGTHLSPESAAAIGMIPRELVGRCKVLGNAALSGAQTALLDLKDRAKLLDVQRCCKYLELSGNEDFNEEYPEQMMFYEEDEEWN